MAGIIVVRVGWRSGRETDVRSGILIVDITRVVIAATLVTGTGIIRIADTITVVVATTLITGVCISRITAIVAIALII
ncbi:hypothetical protein BKA57DRAFT_467521 [Linnemannia elongata]|nr:hypothetical protein BKA57DRAFT_467521 [Linnemannia elongata]